MRLPCNVFAAAVFGALFGSVLSALSADASGFGPRTDYAAGVNPGSIAMVDVNGDAKLDLVVVNQTSATVSVLLGDGAGSFGAKTDFATGEFPSSVAVADLNGDSNLDLAVAATGNHPSGGDAVSVLLGNGDGTFAAKADYPTGKFPLSVAVGDMNGDLKPDLVVAAYQQDSSPGAGDSYGALSVLLGNGDGTFGLRTDYPDRAPFSVRLADVNEDGDLDAVTPCTVCARVIVLFGDGAGGLGLDTNRFTVGTVPLFAAIGDLDSDNNLDLVASNTSDNTISVLMGDGSGSYPTHTEYAVAYPRDVVIVDVDGDGQQDLVVGSDFTSTTVTVFYGDGAGGFPSQLAVTTGNAPISVAVGDVNGDGAPDLANSNFNEASASVFVAVSPPNGTPAVTITGPASGTVVAVGTPLAFSGSFTDEAGDTHTAEWTFDSDTEAGSVNETSQTVSATHTFTTAGVYFVTLTVTDNHGASGTATTVGGLDAIVVVYDPSAGFVTGGGWINSPAGAYAADLGLIGKANFGFESKYAKGATTPTGRTEFQFKIASFSFSSTAYDWLVVAGARAQYKGTGTVNGMGSYRFMLTAIDGSISGGSDRFRIKIWNTITGDPVYDNQLDAPDGSDPTTTLGGGAIVIHTSGPNPANSIPAPAEQADARPSSFALHPAAPNPMHRSMAVRFDLPSRTQVKIAIYDPAGREVVALANGMFEAGHYARTWDARDGAQEPVRPGIYFVRMEAAGSADVDGFSAVRKLVVMD